MDDAEAIRQLTARYNLAFDEREVESWLACFTADGQVEFVDSWRVIRGHDELRQVIETTDNTGRHTTTDFIVEVHGDQAFQRCQLTELGIDNGHAVVRRYGRYEDRLRREDGVWRFESRRLRYG
ncbi:MAG TPA: nuclear transport factor 2 family protein [Acidimicrobiales bacterium]|jgi:ketosteroid isomerase-like protein|nr:nuclear transport factor 2 family protein [Acidimicrobiales bacterium]